MKINVKKSFVKNKFKTACDRTQIRLKITYCVVLEHMLYFWWVRSASLRLRFGHFRTTSQICSSKFEAMGLCWKRFDCSLRVEVLQTLCRYNVVKRELSCKTKLNVYMLIYIPTLTYGYRLWVVTKRMALWI